MENNQTNYTIAEEFELPSQGLVYSKPVNPHVKLRSMTTREELKRLAPSNTPLKVLAEIIEDCMLEKPAVHVYDMCLGDFEFLLHKLRIVSYGPDYAITTTCPYCGEPIETVVNLDTLTLKELDKEKLESLITFTLPKSGHLIELRPQSPKTLDEIDLRAKEMKRKRPTAEIDFKTLYTLIFAIAAVDGKPLSFTELETFVNNLAVADMGKILNNLDKLNGSIGLDASYFITCPACKNEIKSFFRFGTEFFRPSNI